MIETRKRIWVDRFQTHLFWRVAVYWLIYTVTIFNLLFAWRLVKEGSEDWVGLLLATLYDNVPLFLSFLVAAPWIGLDAVRFANRLVGPIYRFRKTMQHVAAGEQVALIRLRQGDFLVNMQDDFNAMLRALADRGALTLHQPAPRTAHSAVKETP